MNILLIEDNLADQLLTKEAFKKASGEVVLECVDDGLDALRRLEELSHSVSQELPQLILSDMNLPCKGGHDVLAELKASADLKHIPVVILSGSLSPKDVEKSFALGACSHLEKPSSMQDFYNFANTVVQAWTPDGFSLNEAAEQPTFLAAQRA